ncbi:MAG: pseudouridine synthase [Pseudomonadota bacterium]|nr:pseudouridine synthase [Pseudomonadota bacterium]
MTSEQPRRRPRTASEKNKPAPAQPPAPGSAAPAAPAATPHEEGPARDHTPAPLADAQPVAFDDVVSGRFDTEGDADDTTDASVADKRVLLPQPESPKLHKVLAQAGLGSRLEMEQLIAQGRVRVNQQLAHVGQRIQLGDVIKVDGKPLKLRIAPPPARVLAYHKPVGEVVTHDDPQNRPTVFRTLPRLPPGQGKWQSVGRLDLNTEGLLLLTNSGELANRLMHPRFGLEREYAVRVLGALSEQEQQRLLDGVMLDDGPAQFSAIEAEGSSEGANQWYRVTISEGRNREVRRMIEAVGHAVSRLIRIRYGAMLLPRGLKRGQWMELGERDIRALGEASGTPERVIRGGREPGATPSEAKRRGRGDRAKGSGPRPNMAGRGRTADEAPPRPAGRRRAGGGAGLASGSKEGPREGSSRSPRAPQSQPPSAAGGYIGADSYRRQRGKSGAKSSGPRGSAGPRRG